jgi:hypothetical protein
MFQNSKVKKNVEKNQKIWCVYKFIKKKETKENPKLRRQKNIKNIKMTTPKN